MHDVITVQADIPFTAQMRMTKFAIAVVSLIVAVGACVLGVNLRSEKAARAQLEQDIAVLRNENAKHLAALQARIATNQVHQESQAARLIDVLAETTARLEAVNARYEEIQKQQQAATANAASAAAAAERARAAQAQAERDLAISKNQIAAPTVVAREGPYGRPVKTFVFDELRGRDGKLLATNVEFANDYGRRMVFRRAEGPPLAFDVDQLHPGVVAHLGLNPEAIKAHAAEDERKRQMAEAVHLQNVQAKKAAEQRALQQQVKAALEFAKIQGEVAKAQAQEAAEMRQLEAERLRAEATLRAAEIATQDPWRMLYPNYTFEYTTNGGVYIAPPPAQ